MAERVLVQDTAGDEVKIPLQLLLVLVAQDVQGGAVDADELPLRAVAHDAAVGAGEDGLQGVALAAEAELLCGADLPPPLHVQHMAQHPAQLLHGGALLCCPLAAAVEVDHADAAVVLPQADDGVVEEALVRGGGAAVQALLAEALRVVGGSALPVLPEGVGPPQEVIPGAGGTHMGEKEPLAVHQDLPYIDEVHLEFLTVRVQQALDISLLHMVLLQDHLKIVLDVCIHSGDDPHGPHPSFFQFRCLIPDYTTNHRSVQSIFSMVDSNTGGMLN